LPFTPRLSAVGDAQYEWSYNSAHKLFVGASLTYNSETQTTFITADLPGQNYLMPGYTILDLRAGIASADDRWRVQLYGRNVANKFYVTNIADANDARYRYVGMPATFGVTVTLRTR
jgi:iron complex outermembrane receptor protein